MGSSVDTERFPEWEMFAHAVEDRRPETWHLVRGVDRARPRRSPGRQCR